MNRPIPKLIAGLMAWAVAAPALFAADPVFLRVKPISDPVYAGQSIPFTIDLLTTTTFASAPAFNVPKLSGAILIAPDDRPVLGSETVDDVSYTVQTHELRFIALRPGDYAVPAFTVRFESPPEFGKPPVEHTLQTTPFSVTAKSPPGAEKYPDILCSHDLKLEQRWEPEIPQAVHAGDSFTRIVTLSAADVPGILLPPIPLAAPNGLKAYPKSPSVSDHAERGVTTSQRVEQTTYICEAPATVELPEIVLPWWNLETSTLERATLPAITFEIQPSTSDSSAVSQAAPSPARPSTGLIIACGIAIVVGAWLLLQRQAFQPTNHPTTQDSFRSLLQCCERNEATAALASLYRWLDAAGPKDQVSTASAWLGETPIRTLVDELETAACDGRPWNGEKLFRSLRSFHSPKFNQPSLHARTTLPALNPQGPEGSNGEESPAAWNHWK
jgi:hypothetical protein